MSRVYWAAGENLSLPSRVFWARGVHAEAPGTAARVFWAQGANTPPGDNAVHGEADIPEIAVVTFVGLGTAFAGDTIDGVATFEDADGNPIPNLPAGSVTVVSDDTDVATVTLLSATDDNGEAVVRATAVAGGQAAVTVAVDGITSAAQTVAVREITSVTLIVPTVGLEVGTVGSATAIVRDQNQVGVAGFTVTFASTVTSVIANPSPVTTNASGSASVSLPALADGTTVITATCEGVASSGITITVAVVDVPEPFDATGASTIILTAVDRMATWERPRERRFNDADQKRLYPTDRFFEGLEESVDVEIVWPSKELLRRWAK